MRASIYARISMDRDGTQVKVENQIEDCQRFITSQGWEQGQVFIDNDLSATTGVGRPQFEALLRSKPEAIVCWHIDRLVRVTADLERVIALGVNVHAVKAGHLDLSTPAGRAVARTVTAWSTYEGEQKAERMKLANRARAAKGVKQWTTRPFGYNMDGTIREEEATHIRLMASSVVHEGASLGEIARRLNIAGVTTTMGKPWQGRTVRQVLTSPRNVAIRTYNGEEMGPGDWEPILDLPTWESVRHRLELNRRPYRGTGTRKYLLSGIIECGICGAKMGGGMGAKGVGIYMCRKNKCMYRGVRLIDDTLSEVVCAILEGVETPLGQSPTVDLERLREDRTTLRRRMDEAAEAYSQGSITLKQLTTITQRCQEELEALNSQVQKHETTPTLSQLLGAEDARKEWRSLPIASKRLVVSALLRVVALKVPRGRRPNRHSVLLLPAGAPLPQGHTGLASEEAWS